MKKQYVRPATDIFVVYTNANVMTGAQSCAVSSVYTDLSVGIQYNNTGSSVDARGRRGSIWDDDEEF